MITPMFEIKEETGNRFVISPLEQGFGFTLGNSLRRVLLTSLPGAAVTTVKIQGVKHQFSSLKGMREDIIEFILNLKKVRFTFSGEKSVKGTIKATGPAEVKASEIKVPATVKVANPDHVIAVLGKGAKLDAELTIEEGMGYSLAEERSSGQVGLIPLDASFSPVTRVNYKVEETRVGRFTNYDKLTLDIWTDDTVSAKDALVQAAQVLTTYLAQVVTPKKVEKKEEGVPVNTLGVVGKLSVEEIGLPTRVANALVKHGYETVEQLVAAKREDLVKVRNLGEKSLKIIAAALGQKGVEFLPRGANL